MAVDLKRCVGCQSCVIACKAENGTPPGIFWMRVLENEEGTYPLARRVFTPVRCNHCANPPCEQVCPTGATYRRPDEIVMVAYDKCIGCGACVIACPYQVRARWEGGDGYFGETLTPYEQEFYRRFQRGTIQKCHFCHHRLDQGLAPACVQACPTEALIYGDMEDSESPLRQALRSRRHQRPREELSCEPALYYLT
jgi:molybdopterin-containing oxidoreductase family iron-sulfur binding subunit